MWLIQASIIIFLHVFFSDFYIFLVAFVYTSHMLCFAVFVMPGVHLHISHAVFSVFVMPGVHFAHLICSVWCLRLARLGVKHQLAYYLLVMPGVHFAHLTCCVWCLCRARCTFCGLSGRTRECPPLCSACFLSLWSSETSWQTCSLWSHCPTSPHGEFSLLFTWPNFSSR